MKGFIAAAEYGLNPDIHIYKYPGNQLVAKIKAETTIKCIDLNFSRDCTRLLMIGDKPDYKISVYDIEQKKMLTINENLKDKMYLTSGFNPSDPDQFFVASPHNLIFYNIIRNSYTTTQEDETGISKCERVNSMIFPPPTPETIYRDIIWDPYSKLYIATEQRTVHQIDFNTGEEKVKLELEDAPRCLVLTQRHLICALDNAKVLWYSALPPEERVTGQQVLMKDKLIQLQDEIMQNYLLENGGGIKFMEYTKNFKKLVFGCEDGYIAALPVEAEVYNEEEEEDEEGSVKEVKTINTPINELGKFHVGAVTGIKELGETTQVVTVGEDHLLCIWEATTGSCLFRERLNCKLTYLQASQDGNKIFVGSEGGVVRIYDVSNRCLPRLVKLHKFYNTEISKIVCSFDQRIVAVSSKQSREICFFYQSEKNEFQYMCYITAKDKIKDICWNMRDKEMRLLGLQNNCLLFSVRVSTNDVENLRKPLPEDVAFPLYLKVDLGSYSVTSDPETGEIYVSNTDRFLKKYEVPKQKYEEINFDKPASPPLEEFKSHGIHTTCVDYSNEADFMASGGKDGNIILRNRKKLNQFSEIKGHAIYNGGVRALCFSKDRTTLYTAGGDGTFLVWPVGAKPNPNQAMEPADFFSSPDLSNIAQVDNEPDESVKYFKELLEEQFYDSEVPRKNEFKAYLAKELKNVQTRLYELLEDNKKAQDIEQLERDEFVIDTKKREELEKKGEVDREKIRIEAKRKELELECLTERVKNATWDTMQTHSTACCSLDSEMLLFNYGIRERTKPELRKLNQVLKFRKMELNEKITGMEKEANVILSQEMFSKGGEKYIMDRDRGEQSYDVDEETPIITQVKSPSKRKKKMEREDATKAGDGSQVKGKRKPKVDLNQFRLGANKPKILDEDDFDDKMKERQQNRDEANIAELRWKILTRKRELEDLRNNLHTLGSWDLIYEPFELYTDSRKRMQIEMIQDIVFKLKGEFNKEFENFQKFKDDQIFNIQERNNRITEILEDLKREEELFEPKSHPLETPEDILEVSPSEVPVEKHLTAEERAIEEEKRREEEERQKAMEGDNVGQRGIKQMLGGTLELKKNKGIMEETLEKEEWMDKPIEDMSEEEKLKLKEFQQREKELQEEKDKKRKAWDQELKKLRIEIDEICFKFEDELKKLHKKRLYYDMRVYEQELYVIRLTLMLHENKEIKEESKIIQEKKEKLDVELEEAKNTITRFTEMYEDFDAKYRENTAIIDQDKALKQKFPQANRAILNFVKNGGKSANRAQGFGSNQERSAKEQELINQQNKLDPYSIVDINAIKKRITEENAKEHYSYERDNIQNLSPEEFDLLIEERMHRIEMNQQRDDMEQEINHIKSHKEFCEFNASELEEAFDEIKTSHSEIVNRMEKLKYNFESVIYFLQGQVEVPQAPVATDYKDAILVKTKVIEKENSEVIDRGDKNLNKLEQITQFKKKLYHETWKNDKLKLEIKDLIERAIDVQLYKVTKETQEIIKGNHRTKDEDEKKRLEDQVNSLQENAKARIEVITKKRKKLKKEINEKRKENNELETRARDLQRNVDQRKQIMELRSKGAGTQGDDSLQDPAKKFKEIATIRKYKEVVDQQKEEIEFLEDELERFRSRTFPSFANMHARQDYAD
jgi:WD40 repeat protein